MGDDPVPRRVAVTGEDCPVMILVAKGGVQSLLPHWRSNLGLLVTPRTWPNPDDMEGWTWGMDNDAFHDNFDETRYLDTLDRYKFVQGGCVFVVLPDVVGDAEATLDRFYEWLPIVSDWGYPIALAAQDGLRVEHIPWIEIDALFIGGTDGPEGKRSMGPLMAEAKRQGKWVHVGRINRRRGMRWAKSHGADSIDGSAFSRWTDTHLPWALEFASQDEQMAMELTMQRIRP